MNYTTDNSEKTRELGKTVASTLRGGDVVLLYGDLGAGKTTFTKGLADGLGVTDEILSPTFTLMNVYNIKALNHENIKSFVHIDTYRLETEKQLYDIGAEDYIGDSETVCVIEWPEKLETLLKEKKIIKIEITTAAAGSRPYGGKTADNTSRIINIS